MLCRNQSLSHFESSVFLLRASQEQGTLAHIAVSHSRVTDHECCNGQDCQCFAKAFACMFIILGF